VKRAFFNGDLSKNDLYFIIKPRISNLLIMPEVSGDKPTSVTSVEDNLIAGKKLHFYWRATRWLIGILIVVEVAAVMIDQYAYARWIVEVLAFFLLVYFLVRKYKVRVNTTVFASGYAGVVAGIFVAIFHIIWYHEWWYLMGLIRLPFILGLLGILVSFISYLILQGFLTKNINKKKDNLLKGGGINGRG